MCQRQDTAAHKSLEFVPVSHQASALLSGKYERLDEDHKGTGKQDVFGWLEETDKHVKCCFINDTV